MRGGARIKGSCQLHFIQSPVTISSLYMYITKFLFIGSSVKDCSLQHEVEVTAARIRTRPTSTLGRSLLDKIKCQNWLLTVPSLRHHESPILRSFLLSLSLSVEAQSRWTDHSAASESGIRLRRNITRSYILYTYYSLTILRG